MKKEHGLLPRRVEGLSESRWILMDYLDVIVHIFTPEAREFYRLEQLWGEAPKRTSSSARRDRTRKGRPWAALSLSGASRARTGDLVTASHALSQLSYSPTGLERLRTLIANSSIAGVPVRIARRLPTLVPRRPPSGLGARHDRRLLSSVAACPRYTAANAFDRAQRGRASGANLRAQWPSIVTSRTRSNANGRRSGRASAPGKSPNDDDGTPRSYVLEMLPYPSGEPHMGHLKNYSVGDAVAHFRRRNGMRVLHPMGYDAFGLPAENNAIKTGEHPRKATEDSIASFQRQFRSWGISIDWSREFGTHEPRYYRWTQWIFLKLFERGLAYRKEAAVNWCPKDATVLANEQVIDGHCERCGTAGRAAPARAVVLPHHRLRRPPARRSRDDRLAAPRQDDAAQLDRPLRRRRGHVLRARRLGVDYSVFTTRPDTLFGATFFVMAPEHPDVLRLAAGTEHEQAVREYVNHVLTESREDRADTERTKTGVPLGRTVINPVNGERDPDVRRRLRADGVRHRRDHGRPRPRRARLRLRHAVRPADPPRRRTAATSCPTAATARW